MLCESGDIDIGGGGCGVMAGLRWQLPFPSGAQVSMAYISFEANWDYTHEEKGYDFTWEGWAEDDTAPCSAVNPFMLSLAAKTEAKVDWINVPGWIRGARYVQVGGSALLCLFVCLFVCSNS